MRDYATVLASLERDLRMTLAEAKAVDLRYTTDPTVAAKASLLVGIYKKLAPTGQTQEVIDATVKKFIEHNATVSFRPPNEEDSPQMRSLLYSFRDNLRALLDLDGDGNGCDFAYLADHLQAGPGASVKANSEHWYSKLWDSDHSYVEPHVLALFRAALCRSDTWIDAYQHWSQKFRPVQVSGNSYFTVTKNAEISRSCCTEPLLESLFQQATGSFIEERLAQRWNLHLDRQPEINRRLAKIGSITGFFGTEDSSMASDSIALGLCEWSIPSSVMRWLRLLRSRTTRLPDGSQIELNMVSTMGNGFTFPLETAIFAGAVRAVYQLHGENCVFGEFHGSTAGVFGDDIVCSHTTFDTILALLSRLGFTVNEGKSFNSGSFRESCGFDYIDGRNIRPVYIESLETSSDVYSAFNRLSRWSAEQLIPIGSTLHLLLGWARFNPIPFSEADDVGFKVPVMYAPRRYTEDGWIKYVVFEPVSTARRIPVSQEMACEAGYRDFNPFGWELTVIGGYAQTRDRHFINLRNAVKHNEEHPDNPVMVPLWVADINRRPYQGEVLPRKVRRKNIPFWDAHGPTDGRFMRRSLERWQRSMVAVLSGG